MIEVDHISKTFHVKSVDIKALDDVTFTIPKYSVGGLVGHNGAGKTTLIKILSTLIIPDQGDARLNGISIREEKKIRKIIGVMMVSERAFYFRLSGFDNLVFFGIIQGLSISEAKRRAKELLELVGLSDFANVQYMKYSTGMQRKLALARALILDPPILLLDEPTLGMDPISSRDFRSLVKKLAKEKTILMTSHNMREVEDLADKIVILKRGKVVAQGSREDIVSSVGKVKVIITDKVPSGFEKYVSTFIHGKAVLRVPEKEREVDGDVIGEEEATLEDAFVYYVGEEIDSTRNRRRGGGGWYRRWGE
mgnify:CR=1 FL=1